MRTILFPLAFALVASLTGADVGPPLAADTVVLVLDADLPPHVAAAHVAGAEEALEVLGWPGVTLERADVKAASGKSAFPGALAFLMHVSPKRAGTVMRAADARQLPVVDLGHARPKAAPYPLTMYGDVGAEASAAAYWLCGPFAHHHVGLVQGAHKQDKELVARFSAEIAKAYPEKIVGKPLRTGRKPEAVAKTLRKAMKKGVSAFFVAAAPGEARTVAEAARLLRPPPVVMLCSAALGHEKFDKKKPEKTGPLPEGTLVIDLDLPAPEVLAAHEDAAEVITMEAEGGPWALAAFDAMLALKRGFDATGGKGGAALRDALSSGKATGSRGSFKGSLKRSDPRALTHVPLMMDGGRFRPFPALDPVDPIPRPLREPYDPRADLGPFSRWSTLRFVTHPDSIRCHFQWGDSKVRTIESDLAKIKLVTGGRLPVVDHLIREKIQARLLSITAEKFGLNRDGSQVAGKSYRISMVARKDATKARRTWPCYVAGDDPEAGGRAFGSYCFIYSTFIQRTIFSKFTLFEEDELMGYDDLTVLTGVGQDESRPYVTGTREDVLYRLVDNFAGSMALTAAHEIGHLAGLGHDEEDPHSIMNVAEGHGVPYQVGFFIDSHRKLLDNSLGVVPVR